ncbi:MAG TPA: 3-oxoacyl-[acyl-carrier-protein] synthase III C-terminal domain-containing protein [Nitrospira sp.]|jgi:3-oxoacyl-[acyl-carrier-protein] synthase III|nr:3-oxoacyl-[acyl-carrier-protein] synthase III C-terminal domain-containing protein [Nitrospira sp.]
MKLAGIKAIIPSRTIDNQMIKSMVTDQSADILNGHLRATMNRIDFYLTYSNANKRQWLADGESPFDLLERAVEGALAQASAKRSEVELIIYTGVDRGFLEPAMAYMVGAALGMPAAHCFDIVDACMSWTRAAFIASNLLKSGQYKNALIVNCECNMRYGGRLNPGCFRLRGADEVEWNFPAYTVGEAATATFFVEDNSRPWEFHFLSDANFSDLCSLPLDGFDRYCKPGPRLGRNGPNQLTSFGSDLFRAGRGLGVEVFNRLSTPHDEIKAIFPHAASKRLWWDMGEEIGVAEKIHFIYPDYGNLVSASVPTAIAEAWNQGTIRESDTLAGWVGSAGISFASFSFQL